MSLFFKPPTSQISQPNQNPTNPPQQQQQQPQGAQNPPQQNAQPSSDLKRINDIQNTYNSLRANAATNIIKESYRENIELNLKSFDHFLPKDSLISTKRLDQLYALTRNLRKNLEKKQINDSSLNVFLAKENINLQKIEKDISELQNVIQTKYDLPTQQTGTIQNDKFFHNDTFEQSLEQKVNLINSNLSLFPLNLGNNTSNSLLLSLVDKNPVSCRFLSNKKLSTKKIGESTTPLKDFNKLGSSMRGSIDPIYGQGMMKNSSLNGSALNGNMNRNIMGNKVIPNGMNIQSDIFIQPNNNFNNDIYNDNQLFEKYYASMYSYFLDKSSSKNSFNDNDDRIQMKKAVQSLAFSFNTNQKKIYDLLFYQLSLNSHNNINNNTLTTSSLINSSIYYYEKEFYDKLNRNNLTKTTDYSSKVKLIEEYTYQVLYSKFSNEINSNNKDEILLWAKIFYFLRCGFLNECSKYINNANFPLPELSLFSSVLSSNKIMIEDYQHLIGFLNPNDKLTNPFKHACFVYITKKNQPLNDNLLDDINDYIWFHLCLINYNEGKYSNVNSNNNLGIKFVTLEEFQKYILSLSPNDLVTESSNVVIDYVKCLMSLLLYDKALDYLSKMKGYGVDTANLFFILYRCGLCFDFSSNNDNEILFEPSIAKNPNISRYSSVIQNYINNYLYEVLLYLRYSDVNYKESIADILRQTDSYYILLDNSGINPNGNFSKEDATIPIWKIFSDDDIEEILQNIANKFPVSPIKNGIAFSQLLSLLKKYKLFTELLNLLFFDICDILRQKTPSVLYNSFIHGNKSGEMLPEHIITTTYKILFEDINSELTETDENNFKMFKYMRQLESVEEVYDLINSGREDQAYDKFFRMVTMVQVDNADEFINYYYKEMNPYLQDIFVDVCYLYFFLIKDQILNLKANIKGMIKKGKSIDELNFNIKLMNKLQDLIEKLSKMKINTKYNEKYNNMIIEINSFTTQL